MPSRGDTSTARSLPVARGYEKSGRFVAFRRRAGDRAPRRQEMAKKLAGSGQGQDALTIPTPQGTNTT